MNKNNGFALASVLGVGSIGAFIYSLKDPEFLWVGAVLCIVLGIVIYIAMQKLDNDNVLASQKNFESAAAHQKKAEEFLQKIQQADAQMQMGMVQMLANGTDMLGAVRSLSEDWERHAKQLAGGQTELLEKISDGNRKLEEALQVFHKDLAETKAVMEVQKTVSLDTKEAFKASIVELQHLEKNLHDDLNENFNIVNESIISFMNAEKDRRTEQEKQLEFLSEIIKAVGGSNKDGFDSLKEKLDDIGSNVRLIKNRGNMVDDIYGELEDIKYNQEDNSENIDKLTDLMGKISDALVKVPSQLGEDLRQSVELQKSAMANQNEYLNHLQNLTKQYSALSAKDLESFRKLLGL